MNELEKRSFYSFVLLYLGSSLFFILLVGYWYFNAQKESINSNTYYKMAHIADNISSKIIDAQMHNKVLNLETLVSETKDIFPSCDTYPDSDCERPEHGYIYELIPLEKVHGYKEGYFEKDGYKILVSASPQKHLNIKYVLVKTENYFKEIERLFNDVLYSIVLAFVLIVVISIVLSKLFMKPLNIRVKQIENFIQDISHELNTPITALGMSSQRAIKKGIFDKKILINIVISTKQLESIYKSLAYLNFNKKDEEVETLDLKEIIERVVKYYAELCESKQIKIHTEARSREFKIQDVKAELLFSNLLSNAIKYSMPETSISIILNKNCFIIKDEGMGIAQEKLDEIFELYKRESTIAGGFGVGLNIVKQICDEYGIKVKVNSILGKGSEFKLTF